MYQLVYVVRWCKTSQHVVYIIHIFGNRAHAETKSRYVFSFQMLEDRRQAIVAAVGATPTEPQTAKVEEKIIKHDKYVVGLDISLCS